MLNWRDRDSGLKIFGQREGQTVRIIIYLASKEEIRVNRKLIRTTLAEVKEREMQAQHARRAPEPPPQPSQPSHPSHPSHPAQPVQPKKKIPPEQTNAESFYYKKQMDSHTPMVIVLQDNERLLGTIEWYDKNSIKLHRLDGPNLLILKHNIKYMYKDQEDKNDGRDE
jgi:sRNA-binding regulator protein Hfq